MSATRGRCVLLAVCGCTPQVITETLYALHHQGWQVEAIHVLTTAMGKEACNARLFDPELGHYLRFLRDFAIPPNTIEFGPANVRAIANTQGQLIQDITGEEENERFLVACMEHAFALTSDPDRAVCFSIAGGRKTMGACLALAAQCYGRPQDRLFHVLVSPEFENCPDFFYPPPQSRPVILQDGLGQPFEKETRYARVTLVHLPFFSVREWLPEHMLQAPNTPDTLLDSIIREKRPAMILDLPACMVRWNGKALKLPPAHLALYAWLAQVKKRHTCGRAMCMQCKACFCSLPDILDQRGEVGGIYQQIQRNRVQEHMSDTGIMALSHDNFLSFRAKINRRLHDGFGPYDAKTLQIEATGPRGEKRYGIPLVREQLHLLMPHGNIAEDDGRDEC